MFRLRGEDSGRVGNEVDDENGVGGFLVGLRGEDGGGVGDEVDDEDGGEVGGFLVGFMVM